jgi:aminopeptidase C
VFGVDVQKVLSKADRLIYGDSAMSHAMVFTAVSLNVSIVIQNKWHPYSVWNFFVSFTKSVLKKLWVICALLATITV